MTAFGGPRDAEPSAERLLRTLLDSVPCGVVHVALDGSIVAANAEATRILGYRLDELTQRYVVDFETTTLREDGSECPVDEYPVARVLATGAEQATVTIGVRRPDREVFWAVLRAVPALDEAGKMSGAVVSFVDITARKRTEEALQRSEEQWRSLAENQPEFLVIANREMVIQSINRTLPEFEAAKVIGTLGYAYQHEDYVEDWKRNYQRTLDSQQPMTFETLGIGPGGAKVWYETTFVPIAPVANETQVERVLVVARDITIRRAMVATLAENARLASIGMLAASVAHEIMNPLTYVLANLDFALSPRCPPGARMLTAITDAREGAVRMQQTVWDLRSLGRPGTEDLLYVDVAAVIATALRLAGPEAERNVTVAVDLRPVPGVVASESRLCQVFINLLLNAAQSLVDRPSDQRQISVRTRSDEAAALVGVEVSDTGCGIPADRLGRIFEPFYTTKSSGTGLGLSLSKEHIERMGGRIDVVAIGRGTTVTVWLSTTRSA